MSQTQDAKLPYKLTPEMVREMDLITVICNDVEIHKLMDLFDDEIIEQPIYTSTEGKMNVIYFQNVKNGSDSTLKILERTLSRSPRILRPV